MDKVQQKQRWKYVLEKFSHTAAALAGRRNPIPPEIEAQLLEMPELKRGRFVESPSKQRRSSEEGGGAGGGGKVKTEEGPEGGERGGGGGGGGGGEKGVEDGGGGVGGTVVMGTRFQGLVNMVGGGGGDRSKEGNGSTSPEATQNLLDIEPAVSGTGHWLQTLVCNYIVSC